MYPDGIRTRLSDFLFRAVIRYTSRNDLNLEFEPGSPISRSERLAITPPAHLQRKRRRVKLLKEMF